MNLPLYKSFIIFTQISLSHAFTTPNQYGNFVRHDNFVKKTLYQNTQLEVIGGLDAELYNELESGCFNCCYEKDFKEVRPVFNQFEDQWTGVFISDSIMLTSASMIQNRSRPHIYTLAEDGKTKIYAQDWIISKSYYNNDLSAMELAGVDYALIQFPPDSASQWSFLSTETISDDEPIIFVGYGNTHGIRPNLFSKIMQNSLKILPKKKVGQNIAKRKFIEGSQEVILPPHMFACNSYFLTHRFDAPYHYDEKQKNNDAVSFGDAGGPVYNQNREIVGVIVGHNKKNPQLFMNLEIEAGKITSLFADLNFRDFVSFVNQFETNELN